MSFFPKFVDQIKKAEFNLGAAPLGKTIRFVIPNEKHLESIHIRMAFTVSVAMNVANADGHLALLKRATLKANATQYVAGVSGPALLAREAQIGFNLDRNTLALIGNNSTGAKEIIYSMYFNQPQVLGAAGEATLIPLRNFNEDSEMELVLSTAAEMDVGTGVYAMTAFDMDVMVVRRLINDQAWPHVVSELAEYDVPYAASGNRLEYALGALGTYTQIMGRGYTSTSARGDISSAGGSISLELSGTSLRKNTFTQFQAENDRSKFSSTGLFTGDFNWDFLTDGTGPVNSMNSALNANPVFTGDNRYRIYQDITGGANVRMKYLAHRCFGDLSKLILN